MKKMSFVTIKKKHILTALIICLILICFNCAPKFVQSLSPKANYTIVIDAGHGGIDGGCEGASGSSEAVLNLDYANCLKNFLNEFGFRVIMTRTNASGLYSPLASNKKKDDMKKRKQIIENSNADIVISLHMNSYDAKSHGAQVFYGNGDEPALQLATSIQKHFVKNLIKPRKECKVGDYYMLNNIKSTSVLVECGYISNPEEEQLLLSEDYKKQVCYSILLGIVEYLQY